VLFRSRAFLSAVKNQQNLRSGVFDKSGFTCYTSSGLGILLLSTTRYQRTNLPRAVFGNGVQR
jgi:hypothetical protein